MIVALLVKSEFKICIMLSITFMISGSVRVSMNFRINLIKYWIFCDFSSWLLTNVENILNIFLFSPNYVDDSRNIEQNKSESIEDCEKWGWIIFKSDLWEIGSKVGKRYYHCHSLDYATKNLINEILTIVLIWNCLFRIKIHSHKDHRITDNLVFRNITYFTPSRKIL